jgi:carbonic anhydrase
VQIKQILHSSDIIEDMLNEKKIGLIGAVYDISTGQVNFLEDTLKL